MIEFQYHENQAEIIKAHIDLEAILNSNAKIEAVRVEIKV